LAASLLATCPASSIRNGTQALALADKARQLTDGKDATILDTLSAAYAENGNFAQAEHVEETAIELAAQQGDGTLEARLKSHLARYSSNEALRIAPSKPAL
jgi:uncharacterized protein HemY